MSTTIACAYDVDNGDNDGDHVAHVHEEHTTQTKPAPPEAAMKVLLRAVVEIVMSPRESRPSPFDRPTSHSEGNEKFMSPTGSRFRSRSAFCRISVTNFGVEFALFPLRTQRHCVSCVRRSTSVSFTHADHGKSPSDR